MKVIESLSLNKLTSSLEGSKTVLTALSEESSSSLDLRLVWYFCIKVIGR